jgi:hypothetical protein
MAVADAARRRTKIADPERRAYLTQIAALMGARKDRIGEHTVTHAPP